MTPDARHRSRREFLKTAGGAAALGLVLHELPALAQETVIQLGSKEAQGPGKLDPTVPQIRVLFHEADGGPLHPDRAGTLIVRDLPNDPLPQRIARAEGRARIALAREPIQVAARLKVPGFGEVYCYADAQGRGYSKPGQFEFVVEAARTRLARIRAAAEQAESEGLAHDTRLHQLMNEAARPIPPKAGPEQVAAAYESLAAGLHAGERLALSRAQHRIARLREPRTDFRFGCLASGWQWGAEYEKRFAAAFNFATISWYIWSQEPEPPEQRIDYHRQDQSLQWCLDRGITPKGFGYVYMTNGATPEWIRSWRFDKLAPAYEAIVEQTSRRYHGRLPHLEVINEAHDKANLFRLSHEQVLELTRRACNAARRGSPTVKRLINHCCLWAEYGRRANADGVRRWSPFRYLEDCLRAGVEFETVGLQLYYPQHDLFEIERMLDRFKVFARPIHITELACNSAEGLDPASMRPSSLVPGWHGPWNETRQAEWLEAIYTLCYSKPQFEAVGWWDLADVGGHFWPHGGLLNKDLSPKESYHRLLDLQRRWGVQKAATAKSETQRQR
ncbi:MAG TPA: endo-1,4-beta-xylanase [Clostridia bacterium]|nr:endo-1,4-beta-xylanase [Clostridia bacterium]